MWHSIGSPVMKFISRASMFGISCPLHPCPLHPCPLHPCQCQPGHSTNQSLSHGLVSVKVQVLGENLATLQQILPLLGAVGEGHVEVFKSRSLLLLFFQNLLAHGEVGLCCHQLLADRGNLVGKAGILLVVIRIGLLPLGWWIRLWLLLLLSVSAHEQVTQGSIQTVRPGS